MTTIQFARKLSAIFHTDVAGYSRLTGEDEEGTHLLLVDYMNILAAVITAYNGRIVDAEGDNILADFPTVSEAVLGALHIQELLRKQNSELPNNRRMQFRIGINLGEIFIDSYRNRIFGDGVNVAARLETLAEPGGVCVSDSARAALANKLPLQFEYLGEQNVKNIAQPLRAYHASLRPDARLPYSITAPALISPDKHNRQSSVAIDPDVSAHERASSAIESALVDWFGIESFFQKVVTKEAARLASDDAFRQRIAKRLNRSWTEQSLFSYRSILRKWILWMRRRFGPRSGLQLRLLDFCLVYAFIYSSVFFFAGLLFLNGNTQIGGLDISVFEAKTVADSASELTLSTPLPEHYALPFLALVFFVHYFVQKLIAKFVAPNTSSAILLTTRLVSALLIGIVSGLGLGLNGFGAGLVALSATFALIHIRGIAGAGTYLLFITGCAVAVLAYVVAAAQAGDEFMIALAKVLDDLVKSDIIRFFTLWTLFPIVNAIFDYTSWRISRRMALLVVGNFKPSLNLLARLTRWKSAKQGGQLFFWQKIYTTLYWSLIDAAVAFVLLCCLAWTIGFAVELLLHLSFDAAKRLNFEHNLESLIQDPFGNEFWLTAMLITTLIPTIMHFLAVNIAMARSFEIPGHTRESWSCILLTESKNKQFFETCHQISRTLLWRKYLTRTILAAWIFAISWLFLFTIEQGRLLDWIASMARFGMGFALFGINLFES